MKNLYKNKEKKEIDFIRPKKKQQNYFFRQCRK